MVGIGNLGGDTEMKYLPSGKNVTTASIAMNRQWTDAQGNLQKKTTWLNLEAWGKTAENFHNFCKKGTRIYFEGHLEINKYEKDGVTQYYTKCVLSNFVLWGGAKNGNGQESSVSSDVNSSDGDMLPPEDDIPF